MFQDYKFHSDRKKVLEAELNQANSTMQSLEKSLVEWAKQYMPGGGRVAHAGLVVERKPGEPRLEIRRGIDHDALAIDLERKIPSLVMVERKISTEAVVALAGDPTMMRRLEAVGLYLNRPMTTYISKG